MARSHISVAKVAWPLEAKLAISVSFRSEKPGQLANSPALDDRTFERFLQISTGHNNRPTLSIQSAPHIIAAASMAGAANCVIGSRAAPPGAAPRAPAAARHATEAVPT